MNVALQKMNPQLKYSSLRTNSATQVVVDGVDVVVFNVDGKLYAMKNNCPHQHNAMLHEGEVCDGAVTCPMHGWTFDLATGASRTGQGRATTYPVRVEGDSVFIEVENNVAS